MSDEPESMPDSDETPTAEGIRRYPPDGFRDGYACTCEDCPEPCHGVFCGCDACEDEDGFREHPTHHRPFMIACGVATAVGLILLFPLGAFLGSLVIPALIFFAMIIGIIICAKFYCRHCTCPQCGTRLPRDPRSPLGANFYSCATCNMVWQSRIHTG
jgi:hypothetical protein